MFEKSTRQLNGRAVAANAEKPCEGCIHYVLEEHSGTTTCSREKRNKPCGRFNGWKMFNDGSGYLRLMTKKQKKQRTWRDEGENWDWSGYYG